MDQRMRQHPHPPANHQELIRTLQRVWLRILSDVIRRLKPILSDLSLKLSNSPCALHVIYEVERLLFITPHHFGQL